METSDRLLDCAQAFSPLIEQAAPDAVLLDVSGLDRIYGPAQEVAAAIARRAAMLGIPAAIALASNPDAALTAARGFSGVHVVPEGDEAKYLESLPLHLLSPPPEIEETLERWGIRTFRDLAALPTVGIAERLGPEGLRLQKLARGEIRRPLVPVEAPPRFTGEMELDYPVELLEPLCFIMARLLGEICETLEGRGLAANEVRLRLKLDNNAEHERCLRLPVPMHDPRTFLKLLQLDLQAHPPVAAVVAVAIVAEPVEPRTAQHGFFEALCPEPEKLELTLARIAGMVGEDNVGSPELLDTHRPGAFRMRKFAVPGTTNAGAHAGCPRQGALRMFRPPRAARVQAQGGRIAHVAAEGIRGAVVSLAGPWRSSGDWWTADPWDRDEWDIQLSGGALYRIFCERQTGRWFVEGSYD